MSNSASQHLDQAWVFPATPGMHTFELPAQVFPSTAGSFAVFVRVLIASTHPLGSSGGSTL